MRSLFNLDNPVMHFLSEVGDMIIANLLFLICSVPIVTIGAGWASLHKITQNIAGQEDQMLLRTFFRTFKENFRQATISWLLLLLFLVCMLANYFLIITCTAGGLQTVLKAALALIVVFVLGIGAYLFPLMVRYDNSLYQHFVNAVVLTVIKLPKTLMMVFVNLLPLVIAYFSLNTFISTLVFWLFIGFSFACFVASQLLVPVFQQLEGAKDEK